MIYADDGTRPNIALDGAHKLIEEDKVLAVIGPITSQNLNAVAPTMQVEKTPLIYATNYEGGQSGRYFFALSTVPNQELGQLLPYMHQTFGERFYLLGVNRVWPHKMFAAADLVLSNIGATVVGKEYALGQEKGYQGLIDRISDSQANVLVLAWKGVDSSSSSRKPANGHCSKKWRWRFSACLRPTRRSFMARQRTCTSQCPL